jgi:hypothetical protein
MPDETLLTMADEVRGKTLRLLDGVPEDVARFTAGLSNSVLWHAGHALMLVEHLCILPATGGTPQYPRGWFEMFGWQSRPAAVPRDAWPPLAEVVDRLREQHDRLRGVINALTPEQLGRVTDPARNRTLRYSIVHGLRDEATHQGEIHLLRKLYGRQSAVATSTGS